VIPKRKPFQESKSNSDVRFQRILVIRGGGLGDFILILPVLAALRSRWPTARLEILCNPEFGELATSCGFAEAARSIHNAEIATLFTETPADRRDALSITRYLRTFDLVISFLQDSSGHLERNLRSSVARIVFIPPPVENETHAAAQFLGSLRVLGIEPSLPLPRLRLPRESRAFAQEILISNFGSPASFPVAFHPGSGSRRKNWSTRGFCEVMLWTKNQLGYGSLLVTGEADAETRESLRQQLGNASPFELHQCPLLQLASVLQCCRLLIGNDSGISHLAAAVGTPVLALFGPTSPKVWRPLGHQVQILKFEEASPERIRAEIEVLLRR